MRQSHLQHSQPDCSVQGKIHTLLLCHCSLKCKSEMQPTSHKLKRHDSTGCMQVYTCLNVAQHQMLHSAAGTKLSKPRQKLHATQPCSMPVRCIQPQNGATLASRLPYEVRQTGLASLNEQLTQLQDCVGGRARIQTLGTSIYMSPFQGLEASSDLQAFLLCPPPTHTVSLIAVGCCLFAQEVHPPHPLTRTHTLSL